MSGRHRPIFIQQDNAKPHVPVNDEDILAAGLSEGWNIRMTCQPSSSPDFNVLDLGYFSSIHALQYQEDTSNIEKLIDGVERSY